MALDEIKEQLGGKWKLDRSENFDEFLKELGKHFFFIYCTFHWYIFHFRNVLENCLDIYIITLS